jgi:asparagine synthase (glutamine-hydrolysing)
MSHSRLSIIDLYGSKQPILSDNSSVLIQNGEIYNYKSIKSGISNFPWRTNGDAEVILALHDKYNLNPNMPHSVPIGKLNNIIRHTHNYSDINNPASKHNIWISKLDGIFGFSIWNPLKRELFRTILQDGSLMFASEIKAFFMHPDFIPKPDILSLHARLSYEYTMDNTTLFEGVSQVSPGTVETWSIDSNGRAVLTGISTYSKDIISPSKIWTPSKHAKILLNSLESSVNDRLMSDVPIGVVLSGGLDSSLIASLSKNIANNSGIAAPECWTIAGSEDNPDFLAAQFVAQENDLKLNSSIMDDNIFWKELPKFSYHGEELDLSVLFWQPLFSHMSKSVKVGLCGQGADELHAGYSRFKNIKKHSSIIKERLNLIDNEILPEIHSGPGMPWKDKNIFLGENYDTLQKTLQFEIDRGQLSNFQLRLADRHSMCFGMEVRVPFLGKKHRDESHKIPLNWKISDSNEKMALREAAKLSGLPNRIINRPKMPAGTATSPSLFNSFMNELKPHAKEWAYDYGILTEQLLKQPDMAIGLRLFHSIHLTQRDSPPINKNTLDILDDVSIWPS